MLEYLVCNYEIEALGQGFRADVETRVFGGKLGFEPEFAPPLYTPGNLQRVELFRAKTANEGKCVAIHDDADPIIRFVPDCLQRSSQAILQFGATAQLYETHDTVSPSFSCAGGVH